VRVILSPFALPLRTALSAAKGLRVNSAKHPCIYKIKKIRGFFLRFTQDRLRPLCMTHGAKSSVFSVLVSPYVMPGIGSRRLWTLRMNSTRKPFELTTQFRSAAPAAPGRNREFGASVASLLALCIRARLQSCHWGHGQASGFSPCITSPAKAD
jgi:hypothetical protein